jgi:hypothetical protein
MSEETVYFGENVFYELISSLFAFKLTLLQFALFNLASIKVK